MEGAFDWAMRLPCRFARRSRLHGPAGERNGGCGAPPATLPEIRPSDWADRGTGERDQSDLSFDSGPAICAIRATDPHQEAGARVMTVDLCQPPLRYGGAYDEM